MDLPQQLAQHLEVVVKSQDTQQIKAATTALNQCYAKPDCVPALMHILLNMPAPEIRQIAAVELRKRSAKWWKSLDESMTVPMKTSLMDLARKEQEYERVPLIIC